MAGLPQAKVVYLLRAGKPCFFPCPLTPWTVTLSPAHCFLSGGISALENSVFCVTPAAAPPAIPHIPVSSCPDGAGCQPGPPLVRGDTGLRTAKGGSRKREANVPPWSESWGLSWWGLQYMQWGGVSPREPAQAGHVRRFHSYGDMPYNLGLHTPQSVSPYIWQKTLLALRKARITDRQTKVEANLQCNHRAGGGGQDCSVCADFPARGTSCRAVQGGE